MEDVHALHTGHAIGADLFLIGEDADAGLFRILNIEYRLQLGIGADSVVMAVSADHRAVKADFGHIIGGDSNQLCGEEILFLHVIILFQKIDYICFYSLFFLFF